MADVCKRVGLRLQSDADEIDGRERARRLCGEARGGADSKTISRLARRACTSASPRGTRQS